MLATKPVPPPDACTAMSSCPMPSVLSHEEDRVADLQVDRQRHTLALGRR